MKREQKLPFVGRKEELSLLLEELRATTESEGRLLLIQGEAGSGETRLVQEFFSLPELQTSWKFSARGIQGEIANFTGESFR